MERLHPLHHLGGAVLGGLVPSSPVYASRQSGHVQFAPLLRCSLDVIAEVGVLLEAAGPLGSTRLLLRLGGGTLGMACPHLRRALSVYGPALLVSHSPKLFRV